MLALAQARSTQRHSLLLSLSRAAPSVFSSASLVPATQLDTFKHSYSTSRSGSSSSSSTAHLAPPPATKPDASVTAVAPHHQLPHQQQLVDNDKRRRGFGGKVVPPAEHELQQVVVAATLDDEEPLTFRAYHVGAFCFGVGFVQQQFSYCQGLCFRLQHCSSIPPPLSTLPSSTQLTNNQRPRFPRAHRSGAQARAQRPAQLPNNCRQGLLPAVAALQRRGCCALCPFYCHIEQLVVEVFLVPDTPKQHTFFTAGNNHHYNE